MSVIYRGKLFRTVAPDVTSARNLGSVKAASRIAVPLEEIPKAPILAESILECFERKSTAARISATHCLMLT